MKRVRRLATIALVCVVIPMVGRASNSSSPDTDTPVDPAVYDPDAAPQAYLDARKPKPTEDEIAAAKKEQQRLLEDKDWFVRSYEQQMRTQSGDKPDGANVYDQISQDKDLARLAGIAPSTASSDGDASGAASATDYEKQKEKSRNATSPLPTMAGKPLDNSIVSFQPLVTPLAATDVAGFHSFYSSLPVISASSLPKDDKIRVTSHNTEIQIDPAAIETPGMIAAQSNPGAYNEVLTSTDPSLDHLPGEREDRSSALQNQEEQLAFRSNADQLQKQQALALTAPNAMPATPAKPVINQQQLQAEKDAEPTMVHASSSERNRIQDPYDFLSK